MREKNKCLYKIHLRGLSGVFDPAYAVASSLDEAYQMVRDFLDRKNYGFEKDRQLIKIEVVADTDEYTDAPSMLFLS